MRWTSTLSVAERLGDAVAEAAKEIDVQFGGDHPDLILAFVSDHHRESFEHLPALIRNVLGGGSLIGCSASGVIGRGTEVQARPALSLTVAVLPDVEIFPFHLDTGSLPDGGAGPRAWEERLGVFVEKAPHFLLFPEPRSFDIEGVLRGLDRAYPAAVKVGGVASGAFQGEENALFLGASVYHAGAVGVALSGNVEVDTVVSQGCRPIGDPMFVTKCRGQLVVELDGRPAGDVLRRVYERSDERDRKLFRRSLCLGIVMRGNQQRYQAGEFLIRNLLGLDERSGAIAIGAEIEESQVVQFHVRDAQTSAEDLDRLLATYASCSDGVRPEGALLFSCLGRGLAFYGRPDHDTDVFRRHLGEIPLGGFFCNGEIGVIDGRSFLHGYTSSFGLFRGRPRA